jgi:predicted outer membrane protein
VQYYGRTLEQDHTTLDGKLNALAKDENIDLAATATPSVQGFEAMLTSMGDEIKQAPAGKFDRVFVDKMASGHQDAIQLVKDGAAQFGDDKQIQALASQALPVLNAHKATAVKLQGEVTNAH